MSVNFKYLKLTWNVSQKNLINSIFKLLVFVSLRFKQNEMFSYIDKTLKMSEKTEIEILKRSNEMLNIKHQKISSNKMF